MKRTSLREVEESAALRGVRVFVERKPRPKKGRKNRYKRRDMRADRNQYETK